MDNKIPNWSVIHVDEYLKFKKKLKSSVIFVRGMNSECFCIEKVTSSIYNLIPQ